MEFPIPQPYQTDILRQYAQNLSRHPVIKSEVEAFLRDSEETFALCVKYLYGHMAVQDLLSFPVETFAGYVRATLAAIQQIDYLKTVPPEVFFPYVLYHRVNSEYADNSRGYLLETLLPHVRGKTMEQARG